MVQFPATHHRQQFADGTSKELQMAKKQQETAIVPPPTNTEMIVAPDYGDDAGLGFENQTKADSAWPMIVQLQALSPAVKDEVPGARPGNFMNTVTGEIYDRDKGVLFVPAYTQHYFAEWTPRKEGGGFHGHLDIDDDRVKAAIAASKKYGKYRDTVMVTRDGKEVEAVRELVETFYIYGCICDEDGNAVTMATISFWSTKIRSYKAWNSSVKQLMIKQADGTRRRPPMFAHLVRMTSRPKKNSDGDFWVPHLAPAVDNSVIKSLLSPDDERYQMARQGRQLFIDGDAKVNYESQNDQGGDDDNNDEAPKGKTPF